VPTQQTFARKIYASQLTTAAGICAMADLVRQEKLPTSGFLRQEECVSAEFLANRFGSLYRQGKQVAQI
jgi:saccharopine dehydrogenase-like NADP-dependent oxidoreductase